MFAFITPIFTGIAFLYNLIPAPFRMIANWIMIGVAIVGVAFSYLKIKEHEARQQALIRLKLNYHKKKMLNIKINLINLL
jgi:hypothetical protein